MEQIRIQQPKLMQQNGLKLNVVGIANSKHAIFCREGLNLETCIDELKKERTGKFARTSERRNPEDEYL